MEGKRERAERIGQSVVSCAMDLLDKLCEGEPEGVRDMARAVMATRMLTFCAWGDYFHLPPLDDC